MEFSLLLRLSEGRDEALGPGLRAQLQKGAIIGSVLLRVRQRRLLSEPLFFGNLVHILGVLIGVLLDAKHLGLDLVHSIVTSCHQLGLIWKHLTLHVLLLGEAERRVCRGVVGLVTEVEVIRMRRSDGLLLSRVVLHVLLGMLLLLLGVLLDGERIVTAHFKLTNI